MKTKFYVYLICLTAASFLTFSSCDKEKTADTVKPAIHLIAPEEGETLEIGDEHGIHLEMELSDDVKLNSYKVDIHPNFDGHSHTRAASETVDFRYVNRWDVTGKNAHIHHHDIKIPSNATPGNYHLMVYCIDAAGNETFVARNIVLSTEGGGDDGHEH